MPSVSSSSSPKVLDSSTVMTPSLPTLSMASAIGSPMVGSAAEIEAVAAICSLVSTSLAGFSSCWETASTAFSIPRLSAIGFAPAATLRRPSRTSAWASTVAVVVPSPATSSVFFATSLTSSAPIFSHGSSGSISLAMLTPSLVMVGAPHFFSRTTLRPFGPRVTLTASARVFMPRSRPRRASSSKAIILAMWRCPPCVDRCTAGFGARDGRHRFRGRSVGPRSAPHRPTIVGTLMVGVPEGSLALALCECKNGPGSGPVPRPGGRPPEDDEARPPEGEPGLARRERSGGADGVGLRTLLALDDLEGDPLALVEALVAVHLDGRVVDEDVLAAVDGDEAEALLGVEPLHGALCHVCSHVSCVRTIPLLEGPGYSLFRPSGHVRGTRTARNRTAHGQPEQQLHACL